MTKIINKEKNFLTFSLDYFSFFHLIFSFLDTADAYYISLRLGLNLKQSMSSSDLEVRKGISPKR